MSAVLACVVTFGLKSTPGADACLDAVQVQILHAIGERVDVVCESPKDDSV